MPIPPDRYKFVQGLNVNEHKTELHYGEWERYLREKKASYLLLQIEAIKSVLASPANRADVVDFYRNEDIAKETKFIAAMIWGYSPTAGGRRDGRGPYRVMKMFSDPAKAATAIGNVDITTRDDIVRSYESLDDALDRCGPNFFTKHLYFLGKSTNIEKYPLIFDDRVARGILKLSASNHDWMEMVTASAMRSPEAYMLYLAFAFEEADKIHCNADHIEYFLFGL